MSKEEQFEHIENKIREAIENNPPAFDENAWAKMEALLDKEEKKPKPFLWWILLPLLIAGGTYIFYSQNSPVKHSPENILNSSNKKNVLKNVENSQEAKGKSTTKNIISGDEVKLSNAASFYKTEPGNSKAAIDKRKANIIINDAEITDSNSEHHDGVKVRVNTSGNTKVWTAENSAVDNEKINDVKRSDQIEVPDAKQSSEPGITKVNETNQDSTLAAIATDKKTKANENTHAKKKQSTQEQKKSSPFYFLALLGPDIGSVKLFSFNNSSVTAKYGLGAGYQLTRKLSLQTGFYAGKKKYIAGPDDYHTKYSSTDPNYKLNSVDANCMVYEIPLTVRYDFLQKSSFLYYASTGLSSYMMKKEDYHYYYTNYNVPGEKYYSYTGNKHLFSNLSIAAGIEKRMSPSLSLLAEPSVSIPLSGVGQGKVKLYSTAIMLGIKYIPFKK